MNTNNLWVHALTLSLAAVAWNGQGQTWAETYSFTKFGNLNSLAIPDGDASGTVDSRTIQSSITDIQSVSVTLDINSQFNGDLFIYLLHGDHLAVLLNRVGKTDTNPYGYSDAGMNVTLSDKATATDIHDYQMTLSLPPGKLLTGEWLADGRNEDPASVLDASARTAGLEVFRGDNASGEWLLFMSDNNPGAQSELISWSLTVTPVPEPATWTLLCGGLAFLGVRRLRKS